MHNDIDGGEKCGEIPCRALIANLIGDTDREADAGRRETSSRHAVLHTVDFLQQVILTNSTPRTNEQKG